MSFFVSSQNWLLSRPSVETHIFVTGAPRSGTSLLKNVLVAHSALTGTDRESTGLIRIRNLSKFQIGELDASQWDTLMKSSSGRPQLFDQLANVLIEKNDASRFVDKVNVARWRFVYLNRYFPNTQYVNIIRDGRDAYCSATRHKSVHQASSLKKFAHYWDRCIRLTGSRIPQKRVFHLRYEDLVKEPSRSVMAVMEFLGMKFEESQISVTHYSSVSSIKKRKVHENLAKPINTSSVGRWREELTSEEIEDFNQIAGGALSKWGYQI